MLHLRRRHFALLAIAAAASTAGLWYASLGSAGTPASAGTLEIGYGTTVTDPSTKQSATFGLRATTPGSPAGVGDVVLELDRGIMNFGVCTVHGPDPQVDFTDDGNEGGNSPYPDIQCGRAYGESVSFSKCTMTAQAHAYMHADAPTANYMGPTTVSITFKKTGATSGTLTVGVTTPASGTLQVKGTTTGPVSMTTCP